MDDLGKIQKLKRFMESNGCDFPEEVNNGQRMNRKSKFISVFILLLPHYLQTTFVVREPRIVMPWPPSEPVTWRRLPKQQMR